MKLIIAAKIEIKKFIKENRNFKSSKQLNKIKHVLNIEMGPQTLRTLEKLDKKSSRHESWFMQM